MKSDELIPLPRACEEYHLTYGSLRGAIERKRLPASKIRGHWFVTKADIDGYLKSKYDHCIYQQKGKKVMEIDQGEIMPYHAAIIVGVSRESIYAYLRAGLLKGTKKGKFWVIKLEDLKETFGDCLVGDSLQYNFAF